MKIEEVTAAFRRVRLIVLGLLLTFVFVPAIAIGLIQILDAPPLVAAGVLIMAVCPGAPLRCLGTTVVQGDGPFAVGLMIGNVVLSVILALLLLGALVSGIPGAGNQHIDYAKIISTLRISQVVPLGVALLVSSQPPRKGTAAVETKRDDPESVGVSCSFRSIESILVIYVEFPVPLLYPIA